MILVGFEEVSLEVGSQVQKESHRAAQKVAVDQRGRTRQ